MMCTHQPHQQVRAQASQLLRRGVKQHWFWVDWCALFFLSAITPVNGTSKNDGNHLPLSFGIDVTMAGVHFLTVS